MSSLQVRQLEKQYDKKASAFSLSNVDLDVDPGEILVLLGPSGSGKTTLLRCIAGLVEPSAGTIALGGKIVSDVRHGVNLAPNKRNLGMVFQSFALWSHMTVRENILYPLRARGWNRARSEQRADEMMQLVRCPELRDRLPATLSGGQQQRVSLARALAAEPTIILFDEPLSSLDALLRLELRAQLRQIHRKTRFAGVYVTHDQVEAMSLGTRIAVMNGGRVEQMGLPTAIYTDPATEFVAEFMGMLNRITVAGEGSADSNVGSIRQNEFFVGAPGSGSLSIRFRPESVTIDRKAARQESLPCPAGTLQILGAVLVDQAFHGEHLEYTVAAGDAVVKVRVPPRGDILELGSDVVLTLARGAGAIFSQPSPEVSEQPVEGPRS